MSLESMIENARDLLGEHPVDSEYGRALVQLLSRELAPTMDGIPEEDIQEHVAQLIAPEQVLETIYDVRTAGDHSQIVLSKNDDGSWMMFVPATTLDAVEKIGGDHPHGVTHWATLAGALASLNMMVRMGELTYNDGREVE